MDEMDKNNDGEITQDEFSAFWEGCRQAKIDRRWNIFVANDLDDDQALNVSELENSANPAKLRRLHTKMMNYWADSNQHNFVEDSDEERPQAFRADQPKLQNLWSS